jgi:diguanylate cyclase
MGEDTSIMETVINDNSFISDILSRTNLFSTLGNDERQFIAEFSEVRSLGPNEILFDSETTAEALYIVASGDILVQRVGEEGRVQDVARFIEGESFGEIDLFRGGTRHVRGIAERQSSVVAFPRRGKTLDDVFMQRPAAAARILHKLIAMVAGRIRSTNTLISENAPWIQELRKQVLGDKLTGLYNPTYLKEEYPKLFRQEGRVISVVMAKPDRFKQINDTFGHEVGDEALRLLGATLAGIVGPGEAGIRYRGNETALVLPDSDGSEALSRARALKEALEKIDLSHLTGGEAVPITFSVSVATYPEDAATKEDLIERAYERLYRARDAGGNRILTD